MEIKTLTILSCARCGQDHEMQFKEFERPIVDSDASEWNWWGSCPVTYEPVLMRMLPEDSEIQVSEQS